VVASDRTRKILGAAALALAFALGSLGLPRAAHADDVAEATAAFARGNEHFQRAARLHGARRTTELEAALTEYFASLRIVRSRNVLYNTAIVLEQLERWEDCFNYWSEYLGVTGLSDAERADGTTHRDAVRPHVAVLSIASTPSGAEVWIDRRDLTSRGHTPFDFAVPAGDHHVYFVLAGHREMDATVHAGAGETAALRVQLTPSPVSLQVLAPSEGTLTIDGEPLSAGVATEVAPGTHVVRLVMPGTTPVERRIEVLAGAAPMVIDLASAARDAAPTSVPLGIHSDVVARVRVDGTETSEGTDMVVGVSPGTHEVRIEADDRAPLVISRTFIAGDPMRLDVHLHRRPDAPILAMRGVLGAVAAIGLGVSAALSIDAHDRLDQYNRTGGQALFDATNDANLRADVSWSVTAAFGVAALVTCFLDAGGGDSEGHFVLVPRPDGFFAMASQRFGGL
jgi:hypothetical protein